MITSDIGIKKIEDREGVRLTAYPDSRDIWTIGTGHAYTLWGKPIVRGMTITKEQNDQLLKEDLKKYEDAVNAAVKVPLSQNQFDALVSFAFNIGVAGFARSSVVTSLNNNDYIGAAANLMLWVKPAVLYGRRNGERLQFLTPYPTDTTVRATPPAPQPDAPKAVEEKKGTSMFAGLITQQWQSILRWGLNAAGTAAVAGGYMSSGQVNKGTDIAMTVIGGLVSLGSMAWSVHSNQASVIKKTANKL